MTKSVRHILTASAALLTLMVTGASAPPSEKFPRRYANYTHMETEPTTP
ncbi:hypothetical protein GCM10009555_016780 [Acrocarpospora macrocephala]|uniref:Uncharacterized protein n=1 Tax=Acrocarpospora macrocephala TaxID=150177 RepID=A0A5M3WM16_9ACTN|nr:hypothetical protein [Acrocarpospora macrocephala]GES07338.1 hypothetical protein Amac_009330 [Acrocarpospora macrocephala]